MGLKVFTITTWPQFLMTLEVIIQHSGDSLMGALRKTMRACYRCEIHTRFCLYAHVEARGQCEVLPSFSVLVLRQGLSRRLELSDWLSSTMNCKTHLLKHLSTPHHPSPQATMLGLQVYTGVPGFEGSGGSELRHPCSNDRCFIAGAASP